MAPGDLHSAVPGRLEEVAIERTGRHSVLTPPGQIDQAVERRGECCDPLLQSGLGQTISMAARDVGCGYNQARWIPVACLEESTRGSVKQRVLPFGGSLGGPGFLVAMSKIGPYAGQDSSVEALFAKEVCKSSGKAAKAAGGNK